MIQMAAENKERIAVCYASLPLYNKEGTMCYAGKNLSVNC